MLLAGPTLAMGSLGVPQAGGLVEAAIEEAPTLMERLETARDEGLSEDVIELAEEVLATDEPQPADAARSVYYAMGALRRLGRTEAAWAYQDLAKRYMGSEQVGLLGAYLAHELGSIAVELGQPNVAYDHLSRADKIAKDVSKRPAFYGYGPAEGAETSAYLQAAGFNIWADYAVIVSDPALTLAKRDEALAWIEPEGNRALAPLVLAQIANLQTLEARGLRGAGRPEAAPLKELARWDLESALSTPGLLLDHRFLLLAKRVALELSFGEVETASMQLETLREFATGDGCRVIEMLGVQRQIYLDLLECRQAMAEGAPPEVIGQHRDGLSDRLGALVEIWKDLPLLSSGVGILSVLRRRDLIEQVLSAELFDIGEGSSAESRAIDTLIEVQFCGTLERQLAESDGLRIPSVAECQETLLEPGAGVLVYFPGPDRVWVFGIEEQRVWAISVLGVEPLRQEMRDVHLDVSRLSRGPKDTVARDARIARISEALLPAAVVERISGWSGITVVGRDLLENVDFEVLLAGGVPGRELGQSHPLSYLPSLPLGVHLARRARRLAASAGQGPLVIGLADDVEPELIGAGTAQVVVSGGDLRNWSAALGGARVVRSGEFTPERLQELWTGDSEYTLVYAHGRRDAAAERPAELVLAGVGESGRLDCDRIETFSGAGVVNLAACGASMAHMRVGDATAAHLGGAFIRAGAHTVLLSSARLHAEATNELLDEFHRVLGKGATVAAALHAARVHVRAMEEYSEPFYWANLQLTGDSFGVRLEGGREPGPARWVLLLGAGLGLSAVGFAFARKKARPS